MKAKNTTINVRIDYKLKREADKVLRDMGLDMSSGVKLFLHRIVQSGVLPFQIKTANGFTSEYEENIIRDTEEALIAVKKGTAKTYRSARAMHRAISDESNDE